MEITEIYGKSLKTLFLLKTKKTILLFLIVQLLENSWP